MADRTVTTLELYKTLKSAKEKQEFVEMQFGLNIALMKQIKSLEDEIKHLKDLLSSTTPLIGDIAVPVIITPEEALIDGQISILEERGRMHELTLEETKKLDLFIKNKRLIKEQSTTIEGKSKPVKGSLTTKELAKIASSIKDIETE